MSGEGGSWWSVSNDLWSKAKETGSYVYEFTAKDLGEVATSIKQDVIAPSATALKHQIQPHAQYGSLSDSVATMLGSVSDYLAPDAEPSITYISRYGEDRLAAIQTDPVSYTAHVPDSHYTAWCEGFRLDEHTSDISQLLVTNTTLRTVHTSLVPSEISYSNFWKVYYYRTALFHEEKRKHEELLARVERESDEEGWGDEEEEEAGPSGEGGTAAAVKETLTPAAVVVVEETLTPAAVVEEVITAEADIVVEAAPVQPDTECSAAVEQSDSTPVVEGVEESSDSADHVTGLELESCVTGLELRSLKSSAVLVELPSDVEDSTVSSAECALVSTVSSADCALVSTVSSEECALVSTVSTGETAVAALVDVTKGEESTSDGSYEIVVKGGDEDEFEAELDAMMLDMEGQEEGSEEEDAEDWEDWD